MKKMSMDESIVQSVNFKIYVPLDPIHCFENLDNSEFRDWAIPGENLYYFVRTSASVLQLDSLSFTSTILKKETHTRRSTLTFSPRLNPSDDDAINHIEPIETKTYHGFPKMEPFRLPNGDAIYPLSVKIPITLNSSFFLDVFIPRKRKYVARIDLRVITPFSVNMEHHSTAVSIITKFNILTTLKTRYLSEITFESADIEINTHPPLNEEDYHSNIKTVKPNTLNCACNDNESLSVVFSFHPLSEKGASMLSNMLMHFFLKWKFQNLEFKTIYEAETINDSIGLAILLPPTTIKAMTTSTVPLRITNLNMVPKSVELVFESDLIQPVSERIKVPEIEPGASTTVNFSLLPLSVGYHKFNFWAEQDGVKVSPLFPTYISVV